MKVDEKYKVYKKVGRYKVFCGYTPEYGIIISNSRLKKKALKLQEKLCIAKII